MKAVCIHLDTLVEREPIIQKLQHDLNTPIHIQHAITDTKKYEGFRHPMYGEVLKPSVISCTLTHIQALKSATSDIIILEDDAELVALKSELDKFIKIAPKYDILCLGTNEKVEYKDTHTKNLVQVFKFWGSHALIVKANVIKKIINTFEYFANMGVFLPADWLYSYAIKHNNLTAYAPKENFLSYKPGLWSSISERVRL